MAALNRFTEEDLYNGKVAGIYEPLKLDDSADAITVEGATFRYAISKQTGQLTSASVLGTEFLAAGAQLPNPYIGLFPEGDPGATNLGDASRPRYDWEKAAKIKPPMFAQELTNAAVRADAADSRDVTVEVPDAGPGYVRIAAEGTYAGTSVGWRVTYDIDVDGFTTIDVEAVSREPVRLQWHCFLHTRVDMDASPFLIPWTDGTWDGVVTNGVLAPRRTEEVDDGALAFGAMINPYLHFGNHASGLDLTKEHFDGKLVGYRDASSKMEDGTVNAFDAAQGPDGEMVRPADSRGYRTHMTQVYRRGQSLEIEDFDVRNTTYPFNPGDVRKQTFFLQLTPPKQPRKDLNYVRVMWPGPHQVVMAGWAGRDAEWAPPTVDQLDEWKDLGVNLIVGGVHFYDGDAATATHVDETRRFLQEAHARGMKVIPYVTFNDFSFAAEDYDAKSTEWFNSQCIEFRNETTLMCYGADGWREHFEQMVEEIFQTFDIDGLYIDHWNTTRKCANARHGCGHVPFSWVTEGYHDIARRARKVVARHTDGEGIMLLNNGGDPFGGLQSMFDLRLAGENINLRQVTDEEISLNINPARQGSHAVVYPSRWGLSKRFLVFTAAAGFPFRYQRSSDPEDGCEDLEQRLWKVHMDFGADGARKISTFTRDGILDITGDGSHVNAYVRDGKVLLVGGRLPSGAAARVDREALGRKVREAMLESGVPPGIAGGLTSVAQAFMKPVEAEATLDHLESAVTRAEGQTESASEDAPVNATISLLDRDTLGLAPSKTYQVEDLLGEAGAEFDQANWTIALKLHWEWPFALLLE